MASDDEELLSLFSDQVNEKSVSTITLNVDELKELLRQESKCHKETGHCYKTLQKEYDKLLCKYAEAENVIDELRIGAKVNLYSNRGNFDVDNTLNVRSKSAQQITSRPLLINRTHSLPNTDKIENVTKESGTDSLRLSVLLQTSNLQDDVTAFHDVLSNQEYTYDEQKQLYDVMKKEYEDIESELKRIKELENQQSYSVSNSEFLQFNSLEGEVYRLSLRLEEIDEEIGEQLRRKLGNNSPRIRSPASATKAGKISETSISSQNANDDVFVKGSTDSSSSNEKGNEWKPGTEDLTTSGYHTSKTPKVEELDAKYLSQSLGPFNKSSTHCVENPSSSWLSYERSLLIPSERASETGRRSSTRRRTRSYDARSLIHKPSKDLKQNTDNVRPNTMNSTEDSGFIESERAGNVRPHRHLTQHTVSRPPSVDGSLASEAGSGETYRGRITCLRDFMCTKRNVSNAGFTKTLTSSTSHKASKTPRSWVRGKSHTRSLHSPVETYRFSEVLPQKSERSGYAPADISTTVTRKEYVRCEPEIKMERKAFNKSCKMEALQEEMQDIRDIVLDLHSTLPLQQERYMPLNRQIEVRHSYQQPPPRNKHRKEQDQSYTEVIPEELFSRQIRMFEKLNAKIDKLSVKLYDKASSSFTSQRHLKNLTDLTGDSDCDTKTLYDNSKRESHDVLDRLNKRLVELSKRLKENEKKHSLSPDNNNNNNKFMTNLEQKIKGLNKQLRSTQKTGQESAEKTNKSSTPVYVFSCPVCGGIESHRHGGYLFDNKVDAVPKFLFNDAVPRTTKDSNSACTQQPSFLANLSQPNKTSNHLHFTAVTIPIGGDEHLTQNVFHHHHSFYQADAPPSKLFSRKKKTTFISRRALEYPERLDESLFEASLAAQKTEFMSKIMLNNIATDVYNSGASEF
ncbi:uncharacterized protein LOC130662508 isoform X2 [Hydractinia symbiolongicarpus]|uniref:uncharacterized protein LOC130662508 isoform X2 n=1 Tax=Hydractinia symbiolongicarpus TaxID=13093 RepID=UPI00254BE032|nr:uncharacterized protein LOC130662508 isoform X2 [Hydractinia symbiolongicarpus]